jgi:anti-sigma factor RsiW
MDEHRHWREQIGSLILGHLTPGERAALEAHLEGCASCRAERDELAPVAAILPAADISRLDRSPTLPSGLENRVFQRLADLRQADRKRRWRLLGVAAAFLVIAIPAATLVLRMLDTAEPVNFPPTEGIEAAAALSQRSWGTEIRLEISGLAPEKPYVVWLETTDGRRVTAGSFMAVEGEPSRVTLASALPRSEAVALGLSSDGETVLRAPVGRNSSR